MCVWVCVYMRTHVHTCTHMKVVRGCSRSAAFLVGGVESKDRAERCQLRVRDHPGEGKDFA